MDDKQTPFATHDDLYLVWHVLWSRRLFLLGKYAANWMTCYRDSKQITDCPWRSSACRQTTSYWMLQDGGNHNAEAYSCFCPERPSPYGRSKSQCVSHQPGCQITNKNGSEPPYTDSTTLWIRYKRFSRRGYSRGPSDTCQTHHCERNTSIRISEPPQTSVKMLQRSFEAESE